MLDTMIAPFNLNPSQLQVVDPRVGVAQDVVRPMSRTVVILSKWKKVSKKEKWQSGGTNAERLMLTFHAAVWAMDGLVVHLKMDTVWPAPTTRTLELSIVLVNGYVPGGM